MIKSYQSNLCLLNRPLHVPQRAKYPVIDFHNHLFGQISADKLIKIMDATGVHIFTNVSGNATLPFDGQGYTIKKVDSRVFADNYITPYPDRFSMFTMSSFALWDDDVLIKSDSFAETAIKQLERDLALGARGLKITKELGLRFKDSQGYIIPVNDKRLYPIWQRAGELDIPVLVHTSDPAGFFLPVDKTNEHYETLQEFPGWSFYNSYYSKQELLDQRNQMIADHPDTVFICPHVANHPEDLESVSAFLNTHPNVYIDFSARIDELGRQPYTARQFIIDFQDRIFFGLDMPVSEQAYRCYFQFLETDDEYFDYPDYLGRWGRCRWKIYGLHLPDLVLEKIYNKNARNVIPTLPQKSS